MNWLFRVLGCVIAFVVVGTAFMYPFNPKQTLIILKKLGIAFAVLLIAPAILSRWLNTAGPLADFIALLAVSVIAYFVRESRMHRRPASQRPGRPERTPLLPGAPVAPERRQEPEDRENGENSNGGLGL
jgi:hypothetical protein